MCRSCSWNRPLPAVVKGSSQALLVCGMDVEDAERSGLTGADGEIRCDDAIAHILIAYDRTRFHSGRGGEGTSRPDGYVAARSAQGVSDPRKFLEGALNGALAGADARCEEPSAA